MNKDNPHIAITMGDPSGIGPEIIVKTLRDKEEKFPHCQLLIVGDQKVLNKAKGIVFTESEFSNKSLEEIASGVTLVDLNNVDIDKLKYGRVQPTAGKAAMEYILKAIELGESGKVDAVVTGPIHKEALHQAGHNYPGHTEIFAEYTDTTKYAMMMAHANFRVVLLTTHMSLSEAIKKVKKERIIECIELTHDALKKLGINEPRIGVAGLNPHAGEGGLFGKEEIEEIRPAVESSKRKVEGPRPADTIFTQLKGGKFDAVICMYHDQGLIPFKLLSFLGKYSKDETRITGVNVTLGLPFVRTSVSHGVAFGSAGKGTASHHSLIEAIELANQLCD